jgi:hypothetical protein
MMVFAQRVRPRIFRGEKMARSDVNLADIGRLRWLTRAISQPSCRRNTIAAVPPAPSYGVAAAVAASLLLAVF